jgi:ubiquinone/menaquinone biosynthesis C-methylase UbiE
MKLSKREFKAMNNPIRRFFQRVYEYPIMYRMGLEPTGQNILEIGCGSGYGAHLMAKQNPLRYVGIDLMQEQIALALKRDLECCEFIEGDVSDLSAFPDSNFDLIVDFAILHHVPTWKKAILECARVLRPKGLFVLEEPEKTFLHSFDNIFHWGHPEDAGFSGEELEAELNIHGLTIERQHYAFGCFFWYGARKDDENNEGGALRG